MNHSKNKGPKVKKKGDPLMEKAKKNYDRMQAADKSVAGRARNSSINSRSAEQRLVERAGMNFTEDSKTGRKLAPRTMVPKGAVPAATALARESRGGQSRKKKMQVPSVKVPRVLQQKKGGKPVVSMPGGGKMKKGMPMYMAGGKVYKDGGSLMQALLKDPQQRARAKKILGS